MNNTADLITVLVVDDEQDSREVLTYYLNAYDDLKVIGAAASSDEAYEKIQLQKPDLVFLDIQMPLGDGFSLLKRFENIDFCVVFVTSFDQYAIDAIKVNALDYLLKPVTLIDFDFSVKKAVAHITTKRNHHDLIKKMLSDIEAQKEVRKIAVHVNDKVRMIAIEDILYIEASGRYTTLTLFDGSKYTLVKNLKAIALELKEAGKFIRISKSQLLNAAGIREYSKGMVCFITMYDYKTFEVSRRKKTVVIAELNLFVNP
jgi:two-component system LytT family response regulator